MNRKMLVARSIVIALVGTAGHHALAEESVAELIVTSDTTLDPSKSYQRIIIKASNITLDGRGAKLIGPGTDSPTTFQGTAITADGVSHVTLKNLTARGWETGLHVTNGSHWTIEDCDFSDNFHDPAFGWGENGRRGGILFENVMHSTIRQCKANRVWDACILVGSDGNTLENNDFSHTSNTCLKLWNSSRNQVTGNNLSYGIRKDPGEVHARDSTCVLIESGSNENRFLKNDCRYGGDGIFIRVLNGWVSTDNSFEANDCSFANNNCIEAWSPRNTWVRNVANHGSYGFWLGASDKNVLIDNEASFNGLPDGNHNSPHLPDKTHAGIVFMFGPSSHTILRGNRCEGNHGAGIAAIGDLETNGKKWNAFHWIIENNTLARNRWGIYLKNAEMFDLAGNDYQDNALGDVFDAGNVVALTRHDAESQISQSPEARIDGPDRVFVGEEATFDASNSRDPANRPLSYRWRMQPPAESDASVWKHKFEQPGFYRIALTVNNGRLSDLDWRDLYVVRNVDELGADASAWTWNDPQSKVQFMTDEETSLLGSGSIRATIQPYSGRRVILQTKCEKLQETKDRKHLSFWLKKRNENTPGWQDVNPIVTLTSPDDQSLRLIPKEDILSRQPYLEAREGWTLFEVPLEGDDDWSREGRTPETVESISLGFDSWGADPLVIWIDGLVFE